jgi:hypothetical protein
MIDHRNAPGIPDDLVHKAGVVPVRSGQMLECATLGCAHCAAVVVVNPLRTRERAYCPKCDRYICDVCKAATLLPNYVHRSFQEIADMVRSGRYTVSGPSSAPILIPVKEAQDGQASI